MAIYFNHTRHTRLRGPGVPNNYTIWDMQLRPKGYRSLSWTQLTNWQFLNLKKKQSYSFMNNVVFRIYDIIRTDVVKSNSFNVQRIVIDITLRCYKSWRTTISSWKLTHKNWNGFQDKKMDLNKTLHLKKIKKWWKIDKNN